MTIFYSQTPVGRAEAVAARPLRTEGLVRSVPCSPMWNYDRLKRAVLGTIGLPNPGASAGCSPILREVLIQSGLAHAVDVEIAQDGDDLGHQGGNALDVVGPSDAQTRMIADLGRRLAPLFNVVAFTTASGVQTLVWMGQVVDAQDQPALASFAARCTTSVHLASSSLRLLVGMGSSLEQSDLAPMLPPGEMPYIPANNGIVGDRVYAEPPMASTANLDARQEVL